MKIWIVTSYRWWRHNHFESVWSSIWLTIQSDIWWHINNVYCRLWLQTMGRWYQRQIDKNIVEIHKLNKETVKYKEGATVPTNKDNFIEVVQELPRIGAKVVFRSRYYSINYQSSTVRHEPESFKGVFTEDGFLRDDGKFYDSNLDVLSWSYR